MQKMCITDTVYFLYLDLSMHLYCVIHLIFYMKYNFIRKKVREKIQFKFLGVQTHIEKQDTKHIAMITQLIGAENSDLLALKSADLLLTNM